ncbi:MAG: hypothetical protein ACYS1C_03060, partial [Planctomycetota bacterium]
NRYQEAISELERVLEVKGKVFQRAREKAERLIASYTEERERYHRSRIQQARRRVEEGRLNEALELLESVPTDIAEPHSIEVMVLEVKSQMAEAEKKLEGLAELLKERRFEQAEQLLKEAQQTWAECPGLEEAARQLQGSRQTAEMVEYELAEVTKHLQAGQLTEARQAIEFAMNAMPDNPRVRELLAQIERRENAVLLKNALGRGNQAFEEGKFMAAGRFWQTACDLLEEDDERRAKLLDNIAVAKRRALEEEVVPLAEATVVPLWERGHGPPTRSSRSKHVYLYVFAAIGVAIAVASAFVIYLALGG